MGFLADLLGKAREEVAVDHTSFYVDAGEPVYLSPDTQYVRVWLRAAHLTAVRRWTTMFFPAVHARFAYTDRAAGLTEVMSVVSPGKAFEALDPRNLNRLVSANLPLLGPVPFRGDLKMEVALFSVAGADLAQPYLELLSSLTSTAGVAFLNSVKPFVDPIRRGAELLFNGGGAQLEIGMQRADAPLRVGNIVLARLPKGTLQPESLTLDSHDWRLLDRHGQPVTGFPYLVLGIEALAQRADYARIPELLQGWNEVRAAAQDGQPDDEVLRRFAQLRRTIWLSPDLVQADKKRIAGIFQRELADAGVGSAPPPEAAALEGLPPARALRAVDLLLAPAAPRGAAPLGDHGLEGLGGVPPAAGLPAGPISMAELQRMMRDPDVPDAQLRQFFTATPQASRPFSPSIIPDPARVEVAPPVDGLEGAMMMSWANGLCRLRRREQFLRRAGQGRQVLVSEGDSWFQFPIFLEDVVDNLLGQYNIWSVDAAGDTLQNMVVQNPEYLQALRARRGEVRAFLFSGGGNDLIGEDEQGEPMVAKILRPFEAGRPAGWYLDTEAAAQQLRFIEDCYRLVLGSVQAEFPGLPVLCHGYDHVIPGGNPGDARQPMWARQDQWIGRPMRERLGITDPTLQRAIVRGLIDRLNERIRGLCGGNNPDGAFRHAYHVDVRGTVGDARWADELHPNDDGYARVAARFRAVLAQALPGLEAHGEAEPVSPNAGDDAEVDEAQRPPPWGGDGLEGVAPPWRVARALLQLRRQVDSLFPGRVRKSDGTIGDPAHQSRSSDHNPWVLAGGMGVVTGMDITHDPACGCSGERIAEALRAGRDPRIKYIIWNRRICSATISPWEWRPYKGSNPHDHHVHLSVVPESALFDAETGWVI